MSDTPHLPWSEFVRIQAMWERDRRTTAYDTTDAAYRLGYQTGVQDEQTRWQCNHPCPAYLHDGACDCTRAAAQEPQP